MLIYNNQQPEGLDIGPTRHRTRDLYKETKEQAEEVKKEERYNDKSE